MRWYLVVLALCMLCGQMLRSDNRVEREGDGCEMELKCDA